MRKTLSAALARLPAKSSNASMAYDLFPEPEAGTGKFKLEQNSKLSLSAPALLKEWTAEWQKLLESDPSFGVIQAETTSPLALGLGQKNIYETGLHFSKTLGVPVIPGSSIKGAMRRAAAVLLDISKEVVKAGKDKSWEPNLTTEDYAKLDLSEEKKERLMQWCALFGTTSESALVDVLPAFPLQDSGTLLMKDVVTVHHPKYYQEKKGHRRTPSDRDDPNPIHFLSVAPRVTYVFAVRCQDPAWREAALDLLKFTLMQQGLGGKTNAGYGFFRVRASAQPQGQAAQHQGQAASAPQTASKPQSSPPADLPPRADWLEARTQGKTRVVLSNGRAVECSQLPPGIKNGVEIIVVKTSKGAKFLFTKAEAPPE